MKYPRILRTLPFLLLAAAPLAIRAQSKAQAITPAYTINGEYYTKELPLNTLMESIKEVGSFSDKDSNSILRIALKADAQLPESAKRFLIPRERVRGLDDFESAIHTDSLMRRATHGNGQTTPALAINEKLPGDFRLKDIDGHVWTKDSIAGKTVVVNVWYSGCGPCRKEMPALSLWKDKYPDAVFLSADFENADKIRRITTGRFSWTHLAEDTYFTKWVGDKGYPLNLVIDREGIVRHISHGASEAVHRKILELLDTLHGH